MWAAAGDGRFKQRADGIVAELKIVQDANRDGFAGALPGVREAFADVSKGTIRSANFDLNGLWSPWYTLHKTFAGLRDAYRHAGNRTALEIEMKFAHWAARYLEPMRDEQIQRMLGTEFGGMNEVMADLAADTGDRRWLDLLFRFEHKAVLDPLKRGEDPLSGLHGNTQVPKLIERRPAMFTSAIPATTPPRRRSGTRVVEHHTFATGGHGKDEYFREPDCRGGEHRRRPHRRDVQRLQHAEVFFFFFFFFSPWFPSAAACAASTPTCAAASRAASARAWITTRSTGSGSTTNRTIACG